MTNYIQAIITISALVNPVVCLMLFGRIEAGRSHGERVSAATQFAVALLVILSLAALFGAKILQIFGISIAAFSIAGGGVLLWMGSTMLVGSSAPADDSTTAPEGKKASLTPLILFAASPGTITGVITLSISHAGTDLPIAALVAVAVVAVLTWLLLVLTSHPSRHSADGDSSGDDKSGDGGSFVRSTVQSFMGLLIIAMGVQFALSGIQGFISSLN